MSINPSSPTVAINQSSLTAKSWSVVCGGGGKAKQTSPFHLPWMVLYKLFPVVLPIFLCHHSSSCVITN